MNEKGNIQLGSRKSLVWGTARAFTRLTTIYWAFTIKNAIYQGLGLWPIINIWILGHITLLISLL